MGKIEQCDFCKKYVTFLIRAGQKRCPDCGAIFGKEGMIKSGKIKEKYFARKRDDGNYDIFHWDTGEAVTRMDENVCPVGSDLGVRYNHPEGIALTFADVKKLQIPIENE